MYKVILYTGTAPYPRPETDWNLSRASELQGAFGLDHLTLGEVKTAWEQYSEDTVGPDTWATATKEAVELVFGVKLKKI